MDGEPLLLRRPDAVFRCGSLFSASWERVTVFVLSLCYAVVQNFVRYDAAPRRAAALLRCDARPGPALTPLARAAPPRRGLAPHTQPSRRNAFYTSEDDMKADVLGEGGGGFATVLALGYATYALGKVLYGMGGDSLGVPGRVLFFGSMVGASLCR